MNVAVTRRNLSLMFYTVPAADSLADRLAQWLMQLEADSPEQLARTLIFLPTHRAIRTLREAFLRVSDGKAMLLPQMAAMGDIQPELLLRYGSFSPEIVRKIETMPRVPSAMERVMAMQNLVWEYGKKMIPQLHERGAALDLAYQMLNLIDEMDREHADWDKLDNLAPENFAAYWQQTLDFLEIIRTHWPKIEADNGWGRPWQQRNQWVDWLIESWQEQSPQFPIIAAGTTGSTPATARLLGAIHQLPQGSVILPGFDSAVKADALSPSHPQATMLQTLQSAKVTPDEVRRLPVCSEIISLRETFVREALHYGETSPADAEQCEQALRGVEYLPTQNLYETALCAAFLMRESLETPEKVAALITQDRQLARAVSSQLQRWGIVVDDSAGQPLAKTPPAAFLFLLIEAVSNAWQPLSLLKLLKHPLCHIGYTRSELHSLMRPLEQKVLRGMIAPNWQKIMTTAQQKAPEAVGLLQNIETLSAPLNKLAATTDAIPFAEFMMPLTELAEAMTTDDVGTCHLWQGDSANAVSALLTELLALKQTPAIDSEELAGMLQALMQGQVVRPAFGTHPRLQILSPMEARLQRYNLVILADMNEGNWPEFPQSDPWMNRTMREELGLPSPDRRLGLQAHDFVQQISGGEVFLLRTAMIDGAEQLSSRYLQQLQSRLPDSLSLPQHHAVGQWVASWQQPQQPLPILSRPKANPPLEARPRKLSATRIERLLQDPYGIYAQKVLGLSKQKELQREPSYLEWGNAVHKILENYYSGSQSLAECADKVFSQLDYGFVVEAIWRPRFERIMPMIEQAKKAETMQCEAEGNWVFTSPKTKHKYTIAAIIDRLDLTDDGVHIIDFKTGAVPKPEWMQQGFRNQLIIAAAIVRSGFFGEEFAKAPIAALEYWKLGGKEIYKVVGHQTHAEMDFEQAIEHVHQRLPEILMAYEDETMAYEAIPEYRYAPTYNDYEQLERVREWLD